MRTGLVKKGDQVVAINEENALGASFNYVIDLISQVKGPEITFTMFRGSTDELKDLVEKNGGVVEKPPTTAKITVQRKDQPDLELEAPIGKNIRDLMIENKINVYQSLTRWTNCNGKQLCGTCIVEVTEGLNNLTLKSVDEATVLRENPPSYRLSCVTDIYGDATVKIFPAVGAAQWTR